MLKHNNIWNIKKLETNMNNIETLRLLHANKYDLSSKQTFIFIITNSNHNLIK